MDARDFPDIQQLYLEERIFYKTEIKENGG